MNSLFRPKFTMINRITTNDMIKAKYKVLADLNARQ